MVCNSELAVKLLQANCGQRFDPEQKYIIAIQGCSTSGKTTLAHCFKNLLSENSKLCKPFVFITDNFYKSDPEPDNGQNNETSYDYDNPGALDWDFMNESLKSFLKNEPLCKYGKYDYKTGKREDIEIQNEGFNVLIVEGIFAHNLFSHDTFNTGAYDPSNTFKKIEKTDQRIENVNFEFFNKNSKIIPIFLDLQDETIVSNRTPVDKIRHGWTKEESAEYTRRFVLRSTNEWIRTSVLPDSLYFNRSKDKQLILSSANLIISFFGAENGSCNIENAISKITRKDSTQAA